MDLIFTVLALLVAVTVIGSLVFAILWLIRREARKNEPDYVESDSASARDVADAVVAGGVTVPRILTFAAVGFILVVLLAQLFQRLG